MTLAVRHGGTSDYDGPAGPTTGTADATTGPTTGTADATTGPATGTAGPNAVVTEQVDRERTPVGIAVGVGTVAVITAAFIAAAIPAGHPGWRFVVMASVVGLFAAISLDQVALAAVAVVAALVTNGFLEDRVGQLAWHGSADLWKLLLLVMVGAIGLAAGEAYRYLRKLKEEEHGA